MIYLAAMGWQDGSETESELARLQRGDLEALTELVGRYQHRLFRYLVRMVRNPAAADDLFQQTWLRVIEKIRRYDARRSFDVWLFSVARHLAIDYLRRREPYSLDEPEASPAAGAAQFESGNPDALQQLLLQERSDLLSETLHELPPLYRDVLTLRFEEGMKLEQIAELLDVPLSTAKTRLQRALKKLRQALETRPSGARP